MHKVPNPIILKYLPDLLDPMFLFLSDEKHEIYVRCQRELLVFLEMIKVNQPDREEFIKMVNNLVVHVQSDNIRMQTMSVHWLRTFVGISGISLFPYISGILAAILPNLGYKSTEVKRKDVTSNEAQRMYLLITFRVILRLSVFLTHQNRSFLLCNTLLKFEPNFF